MVTRRAMVTWVGAMVTAACGSRGAAVTVDAGDNGDNGVVDAGEAIDASTGPRYQALDAPGYRTRLIYDAAHAALYAVNRADAAIERFARTSGVWAARAPVAVTGLTDLALTQGAGALVVLATDVISEIALADGAFTSVKRVDNPDTFCGGFFDNAATASGGKIFIAFSLRTCSGYAHSYLYDVADHTLATSGSLYRGIVAASGDGSRVYAGSNGVSPAPAILIYDAATATLTPSAVTDNVVSLSVSGDASRVVLDDRAVYSRALVPLGSLPGAGAGAGAAVIVSRDATKAFLYREDAPGPRVEIYDLTGALGAGEAYPLARTVAVADAANASSGTHPRVVMTTTEDDGVVFVSGDRRVLVVPIAAR